MQVLVVNCGSSSIKLAVVRHDTGEQVSSRGLERVEDHGSALARALPELLAEDGVQVAAVGHRVVHGGSRFAAPVRIDDDVVDAIDALSGLAPLHNPHNVSGIRAARKLLPDVPHVAVFDTAFHHTLPRRAHTYALPADVRQRHGLRRYGFHGPSHAYVAQAAADHLGQDIRRLRVITLHLGNGCSACAVEYGASVETSMGMTPLEGLVMGTRSGDVDPGLLLQLARAEDLDLDGLDELLNRRSGLAGLSGVGNDLRDIEARAADGDDACRLAMQVFAHRARKYVGAYAAVMGGVDAIVFTGGIGQHSAAMRHRIAQRLGFLGAHLDEDLNRDASVERGVVDISAGRSPCRLLVAATDEQHAIAQHTAGLVDDRDAVGPGTIPIAISARHVHLDESTVEALFGPGAVLTERKPLGQPGQYVCNERVDIIGPKRTIEGVAIVGPVRPGCQIEISRTDEFWLGVDAPVRRSGDTRNSPGITLRGPHGEVTLTHGVICAWRHIHMRPQDAERFGVDHGDLVEVEVDSEGRDLVFGDVMVRVKDSYALEMHIDTDEANAAELSNDSEGVLVKTEACVRLLRRTARG